MIEGELDYNLADLVKRHAGMAHHCRQGSAHAVCMMIHSSVWEEIGYFMPVPKLLGYEDTIFFRRALEAGIRCGTTADAWIHHFGQTTQKAMKLERKLSHEAGLGDRQLFKTYLGQSWMARKLAKHKSHAQAQRQRSEELSRYGATTLGQYDTTTGTIKWL
jgi:GT2 family glycosyltransferase